MSDRTEIQDDDEREEARQLSLQGNEPPSEIEGYSVIRRLGTGAYGTVWLAREDRTGRMVAIKYYPHRRGLNWSLLNREVEKLAALYSSRNIVRLLDVGWNAEPPYYVMEYVENGSLGAYLASGPPGVEECVRISKQVCVALIEAHGAGVLHCDLKPDNVLLDAQFQVRLCDFGQSRMSHEKSSALGTLYYMAPEQADLEAIPDARWDVYAVGALMYHLLTGQPPYRNVEIQRKLELAESLPERLQIYQTHIRDSPLPDEHHSVKGVDKQLVNIVDQCLVVDPLQRLPNAQAILTLLTTRDRHRSPRPLLLLGVLGPILLTCAMVPIFLGAMKKNISEGEVQTIAGRQDANALVAIGQATLLQKELLRRLSEMEEVIGQVPGASGQKNEQIVQALMELMRRPSDDVVNEMKAHRDTPFEQRPDWMQQLDRAHDVADEKNRSNGRSLDTSWFLTDANGRALWRRTFSDDTVGADFSWRDYFHGNNVEYAEDAVPADIQPIQQAHVSLPFVSKATHRYMVALSVPVRDTDDKVIGVFARTLHLGDLQERLGQDMRGKTDSDSRLISLADRRESQLLDHEWLKAEVFKDEEEAKHLFQQLRLPQKTLSLIETQLGDGNPLNGNPDIRELQYMDPVGQLKTASAKAYDQEWIAAIAPMKSQEMPWLVIVQEKRSVIVEPVQEMKRRMTSQAVYAVLASTLTMGCIWLFVWQAIRRANDNGPRRETVDAIDPIEQQSR